MPHVPVVHPGAARRVDRAARAVEAQRHGDDGDAAVSQVAQVRGELRGPGAVVDVDQHDVVGHGALHADDGDPAGAQQVQRRVVLQAAGGEDGGVERDAGELVRRGPAGVPRQQEQPDAMPAEHLGDAVEQLDGDGVAEGVEQALADEGADHPGPSPAQRRGDRVRTGVAELGGRGEDPVPRRGSDPRAGGERERRRGRRHPRPGGDGGQGGPTGCDAVYHASTVSG